LTQVQGVLVEKCSAIERENLSLQVKFNEEKAQLQQGKEQLLIEQLEVKESVNRELRSMTIVDVEAKDQAMKQVAQLEEWIQ
jgi:hypothetical protein